MGSDVATIRSAVTGDEESLAELNRFAHDLHLKSKPACFKHTRRSEVVDWFGSLLNEPTVRIWIAEVQGRFVGYIVAFLHERTENVFCFAWRWYEIDQFAVDPSWQRRGIGRALVQKVLLAAEADGIVEVELNSWSFNESAHRAFQSFGLSLAKTHD